MASEALMSGPECLIENTNGRLVVDLKALKILCHQAACCGGGYRGPLPHRQVLPDEKAGWEEQG